MKKVFNYSIGTDPEVFLLDHTTGAHVGSIGIIPGDKKAPRVLPIEGAQGAYKVLCDNLLVEFNVPPAKVAEDFADNILFAMNYITNNLLPDHLKLDVITTADFQIEEFLKPGAMEFGCEPDKNAWTNKENPLAEPGMIMFRAAGGHIHIGYNNPNTKTNLELVKAVEVNLTLPLVLLDDDVRRRQIYGGAGAYRETSYGVESRSPSNFWCRNRNSMIWAFRRVQDAIDDVNRNVSYDKYAQEIIDAINNSDKDLATSLLSHFNKLQVVNALREQFA